MHDKASTLLLFGATGDLSRRMLLPSLYGLDADGLLPDDLQIIATARTVLDDEGFRERARDALQAHLPDGFYDKEVADRLLGRIRYVPLDATRTSDFGRLAREVGDPGGGIAIFLSTAPSLFKPTIDGLARAGLTCETARMALEKPLGSDLASSREVNDAVAAAFPEERIFRIDHYLGKETVQNLLALRFANLLFEPLWNSAHIDHIQISVAETVAQPNKLVIGLQPEETIRLLVMAKTPGLDRDGVRLRELPLDLGLANAFTEYRRRIAYERLLLDLIEGDPTLFVRRDEVEAQWAWIDEIRAGWAEAGTTPKPYAAGTWGPSAAIALTERDGISWHE